MRTKRFFNYVVAALFCCCVTGMVTSCQSLMDTGSADNPSAENMIKQGIWTEYDTALLASGKYTEEELEEMPAVGMMVEGDKAYFFTYSAEGADNLVEGKISYNKDAGTGVIAFPAIKDSPVSGQTVNFKMTSDETMEFELTYEGEKVTGSCAWLCKDLSNWGTGDESEWKELEPYYQTIAEAAGPDASIDWSDSEAVTVEEVDEEGNIVEKEVTVTDLDEPLVWNTGASARGGTRMVAAAVLKGVSAGLEIFSSIFEPDPMEEINAKLDAALGKLDNVLQNQQVMNAKLDSINARLVAIAEKMKQQETVNIFNNHTQTYYNPLKVRNIAYFNDAFKLYNDNKSDLSKVKDDLGEYAKLWVGKDEKYMALTWNYIEYLKTVQHSSYGTGMAAIYDGVTFEKYPWEHIGIGDRQTYRANDMILIAKCLFMINLYAAYGGGSDIKKRGIYNNYNDQKPKLKEFCEFKVSDPNKFLVCQIPGAHFIMHKELQKYNFCGPKKECPDPKRYGSSDAAYNPKWHQAGSIKIENPKELKSKLITSDEATAIFKYYAPNKEETWWTNMIVEGKTAGGAVYAQNPQFKEPILMLFDPQNRYNVNGVQRDAMGNSLEYGPAMRHANINWRAHMGYIESSFHGIEYWDSYDNRDWYAAIVEKRY